MKTITLDWVEYEKLLEMIEMRGMPRNTFFYYKWKLRFCYESEESGFVWLEFPDKTEVTNQSLS